MRLFAFVHKDNVTHRLHVPSFSQTQLTWCIRWSLEWTAPTAHSHSLWLQRLLLIYCPGHAAMGMNRQIDWQSHLVCSLAGQRRSEAWGTFLAGTGQSITALIGWSKKEWRKEAADIPCSKVRNNLCSTRLNMAMFQGQPWGDCWETGQSMYGPFRVLWCHLEQKLKLKLIKMNSVQLAYDLDLYELQMIYKLHIWIYVSHVRPASWSALCLSVFCGKNCNTGLYTQTFQPGFFFHTCHYYRMLLSLAMTLQAI